MNLEILFLLFLAHFVADFPLQFQRIIELKNNHNQRRRLVGNAIHSCIHFLVSSIFVLNYMSPSILLIIGCISLFHGILDFYKSEFIFKYPKRKNNVSFFLLDQLMHLLIIFFTLFVINMNPSTWPFFQGIKSRMINFFYSSILNITYNGKLILSFTLLVIGLWGIGIFIRVVLGSISLKSSGVEPDIKVVSKDNINGGAMDGGFIIGILERIFIISSILLNIPLVIGFILTVKSVARLKKFENDKFVEVFIIGSFISFVSSIVIGYMVKALIV